MVKCIAYLLMVLTGACLGQISQSEWAASEPNVLIINSYHSTFRWTKDEVRGIITTANKHPDIRPNYFVEYMDTKRFTPGYTLNYQFKEFIAQKYAKKRISAIVVTDDNALNLMVDYHQELFPGIPVVACGINDIAEKSYPPLFQIIREKGDFPGLMEMALKLFPNTKNVILLCDRTTTSQLDRSAAEAALKRYPKLDVVVLDGSGVSFQEMAEAFKHIHAQSICLFTGFWKDRKGVEIPPEKVIQAAALHLPVFVSCDAYLEPEVVGGVMTSGVKQGQAAGASVSRILTGNLTSENAAADTAARQMHARLLNYPSLVRYNVPKKNLPDGVVLLAKPTFRFLKKYGYELVATAIILCLLATLIMVSTRDVFRRTETVKALGKVKQDLATVFESSSDGLIMTDGMGKVERINAAACNLTGWAEDEAIGRDLPAIYQTLTPDTDHVEALTFSEMMDRLEPSDNNVKERTLTSKENEEYAIAESSSLIHTKKGEIRGLVLVFRDISEEVRQRQDRLHAQKMEAMGKLAGGVAHDFNNLLTSIIGNAELLRMTLEGNQDGLECAEHIVTASSRAADLTGQLLAFSRKGKQVMFKPVDVHVLVEDVINLLEHSVDMRINISKNKGARRHWTLGNASQLQNALLNIGINARDAMPEGGNLTFATHDVVLKEEDLQDYNSQLKPGKYIKIDVVDTGRGIEQKLRERIFEPFFTTKDEGKGTGLGLAVVYGIIRTHRGNINLKSNPGRGTTFSILLPVCSAPGSKIKMRGTPKFRSVRTGNILVVDDEEAIRSLLGKMLKQSGYTVHVCSDGMEAVNVYSRYGAEVDLVILDLMMPRMGGEEAFKRIRKIDPSAKVLLISGYSKSKIVAKLMKSGALGFISKPFHINEFSDKVREYMGQG